MMQLKAVKDFYDGLSASDKLLFMHHFVQTNGMFDNRFADVCNTIDVYHFREPAEMIHADHHSFIRGVGENVVGNAVYDAAIAACKYLLKSLHL